IDVYVHIWAKDASETEQQFLAWIKEHGIEFTLTVTEQAPAALNVVRTSKTTWCDMEDAAGWWLISLRACPRLLELTNDTLIVKIEFQNALASSTSSTSNQHTKPPQPLFDPVMESLLDNPNLSDFKFIAENRPIHVQKCVLQAKLPNWSSIITPSTPDSVIVENIPYDVVKSFLIFVYMGHLTIDGTAKTNAYLYLLAERYGLEDLRRKCARNVYRCMKPTDALDLLLMFGGRSPRLQELMSVFIIQNFQEVKATECFKKLFMNPTRRGTARLLALLRRMVTVAPTRPKPPEVAPQPALKLDWRHANAFRSLLTNPAVADVRFIVEGKTIYAQKSILSAVSDYFLAMFTRGFSESQSTSSNGPSGVSIVEVPDFPYNAFYNMLLYLYINEIDPPTTITDIGHLFVIADKYQIHDLLLRSKDLLSRHISPSNVFEFLFSFAYKYDPLRELVMEYLVADWNNVRKTEGFGRVVRMMEDGTGIGGGGGGEKGARRERYPEYGPLMAEVLEKLVVRDFERVGFCVEEMGEDEEEDESEDGDVEMEGEGEGEANEFEDAMMHQDVVESEEEKEEKDTPPGAPSSQINTDSEEPNAPNPPRMSHSSSTSSTTCSTDLERGDTHGKLVAPSDESAEAEETQMLLLQMPSSSSSSTLVDGNGGGMGGGSKGDGGDGSGCWSPRRVVVDDEVKRGGANGEGEGKGGSSGGMSGVLFAEPKSPQRSQAGALDYFEFSA
ncbi:Leucine-zipper-like transcriptional regulator 1, partial [Quaeritorhiza haematococci]